MSIIKGILFDKDGTLIDFDSVWVPIGIELVEELLMDFGLSVHEDIRKKLLDVLGIEGDTVSNDGIFVWGTAADIASELAKELEACGVNTQLLQKLDECVTEKINRLVVKNSDKIRPKGDVKTTLELLKDRGLCIGLATSDTPEASKFCLEQLHIDEYFDYVGADNGIINKKPHPELLHEFCNTCGIKPEEIIVVGDTGKDMIFAKNGSAAFSILIQSDRNKKDNSASADFTIASVEQLVDLSGKFLWQV